MITQRQAVSLLLVAGLAAGTALAVARGSVTHAITHFLPSGADERSATLTAIVADSELAKTIVLSVGGGGRAANVRGASALCRKLKGLSELSTVRCGVGTEVTNSARNLYFPRRMYFRTDQPGDLLEQLAPAADRLKSRLAGAEGSLIAPLAKRDPFLSFLGQLDRLSKLNAGSLDVESGQFVSGDGHGILFLIPESSLFDTAAMTQLVAAIDGAFDAVLQSEAVPLLLEQSGVHRFALEAERSIRADVQRVSVLSTVGMLLLFFLVFRRLRYLLLAFVPVVAGFAGGVIVTISIYPEIHGLTLAFGSALLGVSVDYSIHLMTHHTLEGSDGERSLKRVWPGLWLGAATTIAGTAVLAFATFPGLREIAVFATAGVGCALLSARWILAPWLPADGQATAVQRGLARSLTALCAGLAARRPLIALLWLLAIGVAALGIPQLSWVDSLNALTTASPDLRQEDERVRNRIAKMESTQFVVAWGQNEEQALTTNARIHTALLDAVSASELDDFRSLHAALWPAALQVQNLEELLQPGVRQRFESAYASAGFRTAAFEPFFQDLEKPPPPLKAADFQGTAFEAVASTFIVRSGQVGVLTFLRGLNDYEALLARFDAIAGATLFDQHRFMSSTYRSYRERALELVALGLLFVLALVGFRYRNLKKSLAALLPAALAAATTMGILGLLGLEANLMHLVALLLILSMGVDYGVFLVEHRRLQEDVASTVLSIVVACATTILSFGLLGMSANPALASLGIALSVGVFLAALLAPTVLIFVENK